MVGRKKVEGTRGSRVPARRDRGADDADVLLRPPLGQGAAVLSETPPGAPSPPVTDGSADPVSVGAGDQSGDVDGVWRGTRAEYPQINLRFEMPTV